MDFDAGPVPQPLGQLGEVEALQAEADLQVLAAAFHLVRHWHVCRRERERERAAFVQEHFERDSKRLTGDSMNLLATSGSPSNCRK